MDLRQSIAEIDVGCSSRISSNGLVHQCNIGSSQNDLYVAGVPPKAQRLHRRWLAHRGHQWANCHSRGRRRDLGPGASGAVSRIVSRRWTSENSSPTGLEQVLITAYIAKGCENTQGLAPTDGHYMCPSYLTVDLGRT